MQYQMERSMANVRVNGFNIPYVESGWGEPLILIHGGNSDHGQFDVFRPLLGEGIRAIAYTQRDSPLSEYHGGAYTMRDHASDCAKFIEALGIESAHLMGTSYGGCVAMTTAIHYPKRVKSVILAATTPSWTMTESAAQQITASLDEEAIKRRMLEVVITPHAIDNDPVLVAEVNSVLRPREPAAQGRRMAAASTHDCRTDLPGIRMPAMVLHGDEDPLISPKTAIWMAGQIPGAELHILPQSRHGLTLQNRQRTADLVRRFVLLHKGAVAG
jgi:pimeloyl-ACP methyl ester carboxylesterase